MFEAAKRVTAHEIDKTKVLSLNHLNKTYVKLNQNKTNLADILIAFCGFMRFSGVSRFRRSSFVFSIHNVKVFIGKSKTDSYREGIWVYIPGSSKLCSLMQRKYYLVLSKYPKFQRISFTEA